MPFHLTPNTLHIQSCSGINCSIASLSHHYPSSEAAREAVEFMRLFQSSLTNHSSINFTKEFSSKTQSYFLEAAFTTALEDEVVFTVESFETYSVGSMLLVNREYVLTKRPSTGDELEQVAKETIAEARRLHRLDVWPKEPTVALYKSIQCNSTSSEIRSKTLTLEEIKSPSPTQHYLGETINGTEIALKVAYGYAAAEVYYPQGRQIVYESSIPHMVFSSEHERNNFTAKAFGELLAMGDI